MKRKTIRVPDIDPVRRGGDAPVRCRSCGRPHGTVLRNLADGRWYDPADQTWRDGRGRRAPWPDVVEYASTRDVPVVVSEVRLLDSPGARPRLLCQQCEAGEAAVARSARNRVAALMRRALGDLFLGRYDDCGTVERYMALVGARRGAGRPRRAARRVGAPPPGFGRSAGALL